MSQLVPTTEVSTSNNANAAAQSTPEITDVYIRDVVSRHASRKINGATRERFHLNHSKLFASVCAEIRSALGNAKGERVPTEIANKIDAAVVEVTERIMRQYVHTNNIESATRSFKHDARNLAVVEAVTLKGKNVLALKEQHLGITILINQQERRLSTLQAKATPDYDAEDNCKKGIQRLRLTLAHIEACIAADQK